MKKQILITSILTVLLSGMCVHGQTKTKEEKPKPDKWSFIAENVADVNGKKITKKEFVTFIKETSNPRALFSLSGKELKSYSREMLERHINQVILIEIASSEGFTPGIDLIKKETASMMAKMPEAEKNKFLDFLASKKMTLEDFCQKQADNKLGAQRFAIDAWFQQKIKSKVEVKEEELKEFYEKAKDIVSASQILIKYDENSTEAKDAAKKEAEEILKSLKAGKDFRAMAAAKTHCNSNYKGVPGAMAPFARGQMVQEFEDAAFSLPVGGLSDVIETPFGFHIIKIDNKTKRELPPFKDIKDKIKSQVTNIKAQDTIIAKLKEAKKHWKIKVTAFE